MELTLTADMYIETSPTQSPRDGEVTLFRACTRYAEVKCRDKAGLEHVVDPAERTKLIKKIVYRAI